MINGDAFNTGEFYLWLLVAIILGVKSTRAAPELRSTLRVLSAAFCAFSLSDVIEATTGSLSNPFWLPYLKIGCILVFIIGFARIYLLKKRSRS